MNTPYTDYVVKVHSRSRKRELVFGNNNKAEVFTEFPAEKGLANRDIINQFAEYFEVPHKQVLITKGTTSPSKHIRVYKN